MNENIQETDEDYRQLTRQLIKLVDISKYFMDFCFFEPIIKNFKVSPREFDAVLRIFSLTLDKPQGISLKELLPHLRTHQPAASMMISGLVDKGYIYREGDPSDRRRMLLTIAPEHRQYFEHMLVEQGRNSAERIKAIPVDKRKAIFSFIEEMHTYLCRPSEEE